MGRTEWSQLLRISRWLAPFCLVNAAKDCGFYTTFVPEETGPKKRRTKRWH
uniref:Uncharacterized protein n=1 Tax=Dulem virus 33 TaxID=3145751 RepID=A0AAU8B5H4_9CAUD